MIGELTKEGVSCNVTAIFTKEQMIPVLEKIDNEASIIFSIFAGRIADAGNDPEEPIKEAINLVQEIPKAEILWASSRELFNIIQAMNCGCHIITVPHSILPKLDGIGKDLNDLSLDTVKSFLVDAKNSGYKI